MLGLMLLPLIPAAVSTLNAQSPKYSAEGIANSANWQVGDLAPYTFATISGENLADVSRGRTAGDGNNSGIASVDVFVNGVAAMVFYVSPRQVNFLVPIIWRPGNVKVWLGNRGQAGPEVTVRLREYAPALFQLDPNLIVAQRWPDYSPATPDSPARPGEVVILYATGLGAFTAPINDYIPLRAPLQIAARRDFRLLLDNVPVDDGRILYAGAVDQFWGLYQINLRLPENVADDPTVQIAIGDYISLPGLRLPLRAR
jgi:uncharacterized protein (TIGR03437 family)